MAKHQTTYDVIVAGAGPAGSVAALQAARAGASVLLIELGSLPGGTTTAKGVNFPGLFHAWGKQVVAGIGWELVSRAVSEAGGVMPDFSRTDLPHWRFQVRVDRYLYACIIDEALSEAGVDVLYNATPVIVNETTEEVTVSVALKDGVHEFHAAVAVDATGDANLISLAGYNVIRPEQCQPATPMIRLGGYDIEQIDLDAVETAFKQAAESGEMNWLDGGMPRSLASLLRNHGDNSIHYIAPEADSGYGRSKAEQQGRAVVLRIFRFLKRFPGLENLTVEYMAPECGIRETAVIEGEYTYSVDDYISGQKFEDAICNTFYQIDLHVTDRKSGLQARKLEPGTVPTIPRRVLVPRGSSRLLAAGRCLSSDRLSNSALRVQASCMSMGQAAGAMAALSAKNNQKPMELDINSVKELLKAHGAIVPE